MEVSLPFVLGEFFNPSSFFEEEREDECILIPPLFLKEGVRGSL
jgi:hypothetical protein